MTKVFEREGIVPKDSVFWFYPKNYLAEDLIEIFEPKSVVVDVVDDHRTWPNVSSNEITRLTKHYEGILNKADLAFANCKSVYDSMAGYTPFLKLVPNGCERSPNQVNFQTEFIKSIRAHVGPVIGFVGNLESKIDDKLVEKLANEMPEALIVLVGSTHANPDIKRLSEISNILMPGVVENRYVNTVIREFDVCIVPHKKTALTTNMNPLKVFVYLSNQRPVVTTNIDNLPTCDAVLVSNDSEEFVKNVRYAIAHQFDIDIYQKFIDENCWESRFNLLDHFLERVNET